MSRALNPNTTFCFRTGDAEGQLLSSFVRNLRLLKFPQTSKGVHYTQVHSSPNQGSRTKSNSSDDKELGDFTFRAPAGREREEVCEQTCRSSLHTEASSCTIILSTASVWYLCRQESHCFMKARNTKLLKKTTPSVII